MLRDFCLFNLEDCEVLGRWGILRLLCFLYHSDFYFYFVEMEVTF